MKWYESPVENFEPSYLSASCLACVWRGWNSSLSLPPPPLACHGRFRIRIKGRLSRSLSYFKSPFYALKCIVIAFKAALLLPRRRKNLQRFCSTPDLLTAFGFLQRTGLSSVPPLFLRDDPRVLGRNAGGGCRLPNHCRCMTKDGECRNAGVWGARLFADQQHDPAVQAVPQTHTHKRVHVRTDSSRRVIKHSYQTSQQLALSFRFQQIFIMCFTDSKQSGGSFNETQCWYLVLGSWFNTTSLLLTTLLLLQFVGITCTISYKEIGEICQTNWAYLLSKWKFLRPHNV